VNWKIKALMQKILALNRVGDKINHVNALLSKDYYSGGVRYHFNELFNKLDLIGWNGTKSNPLNHILEFGTGYFLIQLIILRLLGSKLLVSVDVTRDLHYNAVKQQFKHLFSQSNVDKIKERSALMPHEIDYLTNKLQNASSLAQILKLCNIIYKAPYELNDLDDLGNQYDFIFSNVVLEHIHPDDLEKIFRYTKKFLQKDGWIVHTVNFIDHFANPGFWGDKRISEFNFLKYSDKEWEFYAGNSIAYTNRMSWRFYYQLCEDNDLEVIRYIGQNYRDRKPFSVRKIHQDIMKKYRAPIDLKDLILYQRGTLCIKHKCFCNGRLNKK
jgi:hypothetical protein